MSPTTSIAVAVTIALAARAAERARLMLTNPVLRERRLRLGSRVRRELLRLTISDLLCAFALVNWNAGHVTARVAAVAVAVTALLDLRLRLRPALCPTGALWHESFVSGLGGLMLAAGMPATTSDATLFHTASATWMIGAYQASAVAKLTSSTWRHDPVMWQIAKTVAYGRPGSTVIATLARSGRSLQYALVVLEFGSIALIVPLPLPFVFTLGAILLAFHVATWATLSLPQFVLPAAASLWSVACLHALL